MKPSNKFYIGIDQGSSSTKVCVLDDKRHVVFKEKIEIATDLSANDCVEQNGEEIFNSVNELVSKAKQSVPADSDIIGLGLACQRSGVLAWDAKSGKALHPLITWRDRRFQSVINDLGDNAAKITMKTFLPATAHYAAPKIAYLQSKFPSKDVLVGTLDSFLIHRMSAGQQFVTDDGMAARTMMYAHAKKSWDDELCQIFRVSKDRLARIVPSIGELCYFQDLPLFCTLGDQQANLLSRLGERSGLVLNLGTVASLRYDTGTVIQYHKGYVADVLYSHEVQKMREYHYYVEGLCNTCSNLIDLMVEKGLLTDLDQIDNLLSTANQETIAFVPLGGLASPYWRPSLPGLVSAWDGSKGPALVRALMENIGNLIASNIIEIGRMFKIERKVVYVSGGLSGLASLLQYISNMTGFELIREPESEATAIGAARAAIVASGKKLNVRPFKAAPGTAVYKPSENAAQNARFQKWQQLRDLSLQGCTSEHQVIDVNAL